MCLCQSRLVPVLQPCRHPSRPPVDKCGHLKLHRGCWYIRRTVAVLVAPLFTLPKARAARRLDRASILIERSQPRLTASALETGNVCNDCGRCEILGRDGKDLQRAPVWLC